MQPLSTFFNNGSSVKEKRNSTKNARGSDYNSANSTRMGKSRNISDQCYQKDQVNYEYNTMSPQMLLYKTSGP
jgi:hypothetical protein